jgi:uncharacterized protein (UPF0548 family)
MTTIEKPPPGLLVKASASPVSAGQFSNLAEKSYTVLLRPEAAAKLVGISTSYLARLRSWGQLTEGIHYVRHGDRCYRYLSDALYHWSKTRHQSQQQLLRPEAAAELLAIDRSYLAKLRSRGELTEGIHYQRRGQRCYLYLADALYNWSLNQRSNIDRN